MAKFHYFDPEDTGHDPFEAKVAQEASEFEKLLETDHSNVTSRRYRAGEPIDGTVIAVNAEYVFIDLGGKNAAVLGSDEFRLDGAGKIPTPGDAITAFVKSDNGSEVILTRSLKNSEADAFFLRSAFDAGLPVEGKVEKVTKGGFDVSIGSKRAFCPMGQMDLARIEKPETFLGSVLKFNITEFSQGGRNIVVSRKALMKETREEETRALLQGMEAGQTLRATITRIAQFGAFADIGSGIEGLIPLNELAWKRVKSVEDVVKVGETVNVRIIRVEHSPRLRIALSLKDAGEDPWVSMATQLQAGSVLDGDIVRMTGGAFIVRVTDGVEGLIPASEVAKNPTLASGQSVRVHVVSSDIENRKLILSVSGKQQPRAPLEETHSLAAAFSKATNRKK